MPTLNTVSHEGVFTQDAKDKINANFSKLNPASATIASNAAGEPGQFKFDSTYLYVCVAANTWKRISLSSY